VNETSPSAVRPFRCPKCGRTVLYLDGESTPRLIVDLRTRLPVACEGCFSKAAASPAIAVKTRAVPVHPADPRPVRKIIQDDVGAVVGLLYDALDILDAARKLGRKLKG